MTDSPSWRLGPRQPPPLVMPLCGLLYADTVLGDEAATRFTSRLGGVALAGEPRPWNQTDYYAPEMGPQLVRRYCFCQQLVPADALVELKRQTYQIERDFQRGPARRVNLDPGYLDFTKVVLASFKTGPQKLYLGQGVYADLVLYFSHGRFDALPWTFPDLEGDTYGDLFVRARSLYKKALKQQRQTDQAT